MIIISLKVVFAILLANFELNSVFDEFLVIIKFMVEVSQAQQRPESRIFRPGKPEQAILRLCDNVQMLDVFSQDKTQFNPDNVIFSAF